LPVYEEKFRKNLRIFTDFHLVPCYINYVIKNCGRRESVVVGTSQITNIHIEVSEIIEAHLSELNHFGFALTPIGQDKIHELADLIAQLASMTEQNPEEVSQEQFELARQLQDRVEDFVFVFNARYVLTDTSTSLGQIYSTIIDWLAVAEQRFLFPTDTVWQIIEPSQPDTLRPLGHDHFEAFWWDPVPQMDLEILRVTPGISIIDGPYRPENTPGGIAVRFKALRR
jgi:hypothetical protein